MSRPKRGYRSISKEAYDSFKLKYPEIKLSFKDFKRIIYTGNGMLADEFIETGDVAKLPHGLGKFGITKYKKIRSKKTCKSGKILPNLPIDWKKTKELGKYVYHMNFNTDGMRYYWGWLPDTSFIKTSPIWKLEVARKHKRKLAKILIDPNDKRKDNYKQWISK